MNAWDRFFFEPRTTANAALLRVGLGVIAFLYGLTMVPDVDPFLTDGALRYDRALPDGSWGILEHTGWDGAPMAVVVLLMLAGITTAIGLWSQLSAFVVFLCVLALQRHNPIILNSGDHVVRFVAVVVALAPAGGLLAVDAWRRRRADPSWVPPLRAPWALRLLQLQVALGYFASGWSKLRGDTWHDGTAIGRALRIEDLDRVSLPEWFFDQSIVINLLTWSTLAFELGFIVAVWHHRLRLWVLGIGVAFHLGIDVFLDVGFFSPVMVVAYAAFLPPEVADRWVAALQGLRNRWRSSQPSSTAIARGS